MRCILYLLLLSSLQSFAQNSYTVIYGYQLPDDQFGKINYLLAVNDSVSFETIIANDGSKVKYKKPLGSGFKSHDTYINLNKNLRLTQSYYMGDSRLLIQDTVKKYNWIFQDNEKNILGYNCKKAVTSFNGQTIIAWYTTALPLPFGPNMIGGLPGLVLELHYYSYNRIVKAISITPGTEAIVEPTKGKRIINKEKPY